MSEDSAELLRYLFGLQQEEIDRDLKAAVSNPAKLAAEMQAYFKIPRKERTLDQKALDYHHQLLMSHVLQQRQDLPKAQTLFLATNPAHMVAEEAVMAALDGGRLAELAGEMQTIEQRDGLPPKGFWGLGEGPADYQDLREESDELIDEVNDSVIAHLLRRYRLDAIVEVFERDREKYEEMREEGEMIASKRGQ